MKRASLAALVFSLAAALPAVGREGAAPSGASIAEARALPAGTAVTVEGWVTSLPGLFASATLEDQGFAIQDGTDGIYVSSDGGVRLEIHRLVRVTGQVQDLFGIRYLRVAAPGDVEVLRPSRRVAPEPVATGDVGEETEGRLVTITGVLIGEVFHDHPYGDELHLDDGSGGTKVFLHASTGIQADGIPWLRPGERIAVTGISSQFEAEPEVAPRFRGDLRRAP